MFTGAGSDMDVPRTCSADSEDHSKTLPHYSSLGFDYAAEGVTECLTSEALRFRRDNQYALHELIYTF